MIFRLLSYNIRFGGLGRENSIAEAIKAASPDLVVFQEAINPKVIEHLSSSSGLPFWAAREKHSIGYLSREEISYHEWHYPAGARHSFLEIVLSTGEHARIFGLHLSARFSKWDERRRAREIRSLLQAITRHQEGFHLLVGDYNTLAPGDSLDLYKLPAWIRAMIWISGRKLQRDTIQVALDAGYLDAYRMLHKEQKGYTFPTWDPHVRLDYAFVPKLFADRVVKCEVVTQPEKVIKAASDHLPLLIELEMK